jgi:hypothetical protein
LADFDALPRFERFVADFRPADAFPRAALRFLPPRPFDFEDFDFPLGEELLRFLPPLDFLPRLDDFREPLPTLAADLVDWTALVTAFFAVGTIGFPLAAALPAIAPRTPPTTAPTGPATLPRTAPVAAPTVCLEMGGISMFSEEPELFDC